MIEIVIEDDVFVTENTHMVDTKIHIKHNTYCFPSDTWSDFTFPILEEWKNNLIKVRDTNNTSTKLFFHDGPYWLEVFKNDNMELKVDCINDRTTKKTDLTIHCGYYEFLYAIFNTLKAFTKVLYRNNLHEGSFESIYQQTILSVNEIKEVLVLAEELR